MERFNIRVLVVEDLDDWCLLLCSMLQSREEFRVVGLVSNGLEATKSAQELEPDLILLDIGLPGLNGIEAARKIAQLAPHSKILFVSANLEPEIVNAALDSGAHGYIFKSHVASELFRAIEAVLENSPFVNGSTISTTSLD